MTEPREFGLEGRGTGVLAVAGSKVLAEEVKRFRRGRVFGDGEASHDRISIRACTPFEILQTFFFWKQKDSGSEISMNELFSFLAFNSSEFLR